MEICITGHTSGIGKYIREYFIDKGDNVIGFSRSSTGHDISSYESRSDIALASIDADIFVNNAYSNFDDSQYEMLKMMCDIWKDDPNKLIINISSRNSSNRDAYGITKNKLDGLCTTYIHKYPKIINLKPGLTDTPRVELLNGNRMDISTIKLVLDFCLNASNPFTVHSMTYGI